MALSSQLLLLMWQHALGETLSSAEDGPLLHHYIPIMQGVNYVKEGFLTKWPAVNIIAWCVEDF